MNDSRIEHASHDRRIDAFILLSTPIIADVVSTILYSSGFKVRCSGNGLDMVFCVTHEEREFHFHMHNLLLEIATVDRDESPLRFDHRLKSFEYFVAKANRLIDSKLKVLFELVFEDDLDKAKENIAKLACQYQRIRIWSLDQDKNPSAQ